MAEFTGERVVPGEVEPDLWNEHFARYVFAARFAEGRRVLDAGCGTGYGPAELAKTARSVVGVDIAAAAVVYAREHFAGPNVGFVQASCAALPVADKAADLVVAFEVIEHVADWKLLLAEVRRVLAPAGTLVLSTPNREYYAASRRETGPNPYHVHEFDHAELSAELDALFPHVTVILENHVAGIAFQPRADGASAVELIGPAPRHGKPEEAHFLLAVCSDVPLPPMPARLFLPATANILHEREVHIQMLEADREQLRLEKQNLVTMFRTQETALEESNRWAQQLEEELGATRERVLAVQQELEAKIADLKKCVELLDIAENTVVERTAWAMRLQTELEQAQALLNMVRASRWVRLGRTVGLGPVLAGE